MRRLSVFTFLIADHGCRPLSGHRQVGSGHGVVGLHTHLVRSSVLIPSAPILRALSRCHPALELVHSLTNPHPSTASTASTVSAVSSPFGYPTPSTPIPAAPSQRSRGFGHFYGFYNAANNYFSHHVGTGLDFRDDVFPVAGLNGSYFTEVVTDNAVAWIRAHAAAKPTFAYLSHESNHGPMQVPMSYVPQVGTVLFCLLMTGLLRFPRSHIQLAP